MLRESKAIIEAFERGNVVFCLGNGGSASLADHMVAEFLGHVENHRDGLPAISLNSPPTLTAIANDYGYNYVFARQIQALGNKADILITFSTTGASANILYAIMEAKEEEMIVIEAPRKGKSTTDIQNKQTEWMHQVCLEVERAFI